MLTPASRTVLFWRRGWIVLLALVAAILVGKALWAAEPVVVEGGEARIELSPHVDWLVDTSGELTVAEVAAAGRFRRNSKGQVNFGYVDGSLWLRFSLQGGVKEPRYLVADHPIGGSVALYRLNQGEAVRLSPIEGYRSPAWRLMLDHDGPAMFLLRAYNGTEVLRLPLLLLDDATFLRHATGWYLFFGMVLAGLAVLMIYNAFLAAGLRDAGFFSLVLFLAAMQLVIYRDSNLFPALRFLNDTEGWFYPAGLLLALGTGLRYWRFVSHGSEPALERLLQWLQWGAFAALPVASSIPAAWLYSVILILLPVLLVATTWAVVRGHEAMRRALPAFVTFLLATFVYVLTHTGWVTSAFANALYVVIGQSGVLVAVTLMSIAHASINRDLSDAVERERVRSQLREQFLLTMSHELRNPMNALLATATLLEQTPLDAEQQEYLLRQKAAGRQMLRLIDDVLDFSRLEKGMLPLEDGPFRLGELVEELRWVVASEAEARGIRLVLPTLENDPCLRGDRQRLLQILLNLVGNALKFTPEGEVVLDLSCDEAVDRGWRRCRFEVRDTGIGISDDMRARLFQPFSQLESHRARQFGGAGMGLAISHGLVARMGGRLQVDSVLGKGSRFWFELSFASCQEEESSRSMASTDKATADIPAGCRVLVVEDDRLNRLIMERFLQTLAVEAVLADSGEEALERLRHERRIDLVLMDISMPGMDGYETTRRIREELALKTLPVIALTAHAIDGERERCLDAGMNDFVTKPIELDRLRILLARHLAG